MVYSYTPAYYSTLHDSITSLCKTILPFGFKKRPRLPASDRKLSKLQSDNLKWQQDSFHQIMNLMGLHKEGILAETEVSAFRTHLLETLIASPAEQEQPVILRDKLLFLQVKFLYNFVLNFIAQNLNQHKFEIPHHYVLGFLLSLRFEIRVARLTEKKKSFFIPKH